MVLYMGLWENWNPNGQSFSIQNLLEIVNTLKLSKFRSRILSNIGKCTENLHFLNSWPPILDNIRDRNFYKVFWAIF
jgi:hypothetical protein